MKSKLPPLASELAAASTPSQTAPPAVSTPSPGTAPNAQAPAITGESVFQRLRYFENLASQYERHIEALQAAVKRQGGAPPTAYFEPLTGIGGSYTPKVKG